jgi:hypothetical protein
MAEVPIHGGFVALIDDADVTLVSKYKWYMRNGYAYTTFHRLGCSKTDKNRNVNLSMHRLIIEAEVGQSVDHRNRNRLDNRRSNLRLVTTTQNNWNVTPAIGVSGYLGVRQMSLGCFMARTNTKYVGCFKTALEAAQARDLAVIEERGEFAVLNFPKETLPVFVQRSLSKVTGERTSKTVGVSFAKHRKAKKKWRAVKAKVHLGWFETEQQAIEAIKNANKIIA